MSDLSPAVLGNNAVDPGQVDRLSTRYLIAAAARTISEVSRLAADAEERAKPLATLSVDTEIRCASATDRATFTDELAAAVTSLVAKYHDERAPRGRWHRIAVAAHPRWEPERPSARRQEDHRER